MINNLTEHYKNFSTNLFLISQLMNLFNYIKFYIYNLLVGKYTIILYKNFLKSIPDNSTVLDIGIGNGYALIQNSDLIIKKNITILGVDIDQASINIAKKCIKENKLETNIEVNCLNIYELTTDEKYDYIYFSNSYSVIPGINEMMNFVFDKFIKDDGKIVLSTTLDNRSNYLKELVKPKLKHILLGIDFGKHMILDRFINDMTDNKFVIKSIENVHQGWIPIWGNIDIFTFFLTKRS